MLNGSNINFSANAFNHNNPVLQMIKERKKYSKEVQDIMKEENCRQMSFEQFFRIVKFECDIPQFLDDLFKHMTTISLKEFVRK